MVGVKLLELTLSSPALLSTAMVLLLLWLIRLFTNQKNKLSLPVAEIPPGNKGLTEAFMKAIAMYPETPFILPLPQPWVILPSSLIDEVKNLPEDQVSLGQHLRSFMLTKHTGIGDLHDLGAAVVRTDLTRNISKVISGLQDEITYALDREVGTSLQEWTSIPVFGSMLQVVALLSGRAFVGLPLSRDKEWTDATVNYTVDAMRAVNALRGRRLLATTLLSPFMPELRRVLSYRKLIMRKLKPQVDRILAVRSKMLAASEDNKGEQDGGQDRDDNGDAFSLIHWLLKHVPDISAANSTILGRSQMVLSFVAIHTASIALSQALLDLAAHPECVPQLRAEIEDVLREDGCADGVLGKASFQKLRRLDSFIRESQRMNPVSMIAMARKVTARNGLTLSTGHMLPYGTTIGFGHRYHPKTQLPPDASQPPLTSFHPWRYCVLRAQPGHEHKHHYVSVGADNMTFGNGPHACPGRFFAAIEIKIILVEMLRRWDIGLGPGGEGKGVKYQRPKTVQNVTAYSVDPTATVWLRDRRVGVEGEGEG